MPIPLLPPETPPPEPIGPMTDTQWREWDVYLRRVELINRQEGWDTTFAEWAALRAERTAARPLDLATREAHAKAQADTAVAMQANVAVQRDMVKALSEPPAAGVPGGDNASIVRQLLESMLASGRNGDQLTDDAQALLRAFRRLYPAASTVAPK